MTRDMLADAPCDDMRCDWCSEEAPRLLDAEKLFGGFDVGEICPLCAEARAKELDDDEHAYDRAVHLMEEWR